MGAAEQPLSREVVEVRPAYSTVSGYKVGQGDEMPSDHDGLLAAGQGAHDTLLGFLVDPVLSAMADILLPLSFRESTFKRSLEGIGLLPDGALVGGVVPTGWESSRQRGCQDRGGAGRGEGGGGGTIRSW